MPSDLQLDRDTLELVTVAAAATAGLCLLLVLFALGRVRALNSRLRRVSPAPSEAAPVGADPSALRHTAVVRYDAFGDMGGRLSFSAALFDDQGDGLVFSSINGRTETRTYAKELVDLRSEQTLSPEEEQAIAAARRH
ncbi:MAG: DUF4446 family protein [Actinomycetes bacterium]